MDFPVSKRRRVARLPIRARPYKLILDPADSFGDPADERRCDIPRASRTRPLVDVFAHKSGSILFTDSDHKSFIVDVSQNGNHRFMLSALKYDNGKECRQIDDLLDCYGDKVLWCPRGLRTLSVFDLNTRVVHQSTWSRVHCACFGDHGAIYFANCYFEVQKLYANDGGIIDTSTAFDFAFTKTAVVCMCYDHNSEQLFLFQEYESVLVLSKDLEYLRSFELGVDAYVWCARFDYSRGVSRLFVLGDKAPHAECEGATILVAAFDNNDDSLERVNLGTEETQLVDELKYPMCLDVDTRGRPLVGFAGGVRIFDPTTSRVALLGCVLSEHLADGLPLPDCLQ